MSAGKDAAAAVAPKRHRRWRRWLLILGCVAVVLRVSLGLLLPTIVDRIARSQGMTCSIGKFDLSLLGGSVELWDLELRPTAADAARLLRVEYATVDVDMSALFTATLRVHRVEIDGVDAEVERGTDGRWSWDTATAAATGAPAVAPPAASPLDPNTPFEFGAPLEVRALRAQHVRVHVRDAATSPPFDAHLTLSARVSDLGSPSRATRLELDAWSPELLDALRIEGDGRSSGASLLADLRARVVGLRPGPLARQLATLGVQPVADTLDFELRAHAQLEPTDATATACRGEVTLGTVLLRADRAEAVAVDAVAVPLTRVARDRLDVGEVTVRGVRGNAARGPAGTLLVAGLDLIGGAAPAPAATATVTAPQPSVPWTLAALRVDEVALTFADAAVTPATVTTLFADEIALRAPMTADGRLKIELRAPGVFDRLGIEGACAPMHATPTFDLRLAVTGIAPHRLQPYLAAAGIESTLADGSLRARLQGAFRDADGHTLGDAALTDLELHDGDTRLAAASASLQGLDIDARGVRARRVALRAAGLPVRSTAAGALEACGVRVRDAGAPPEFALQISEVSLEADDLASTDTDAAPTVLRAKVAIADAIEALTANGSVTRSADGTLMATLELHGTGMTLAALKPVLGAAGLAPEWAAAEFTAMVDARVAAAGTEVSVYDVKLSDATQELLALERASVAGLTTSDGGVRIGNLDVRRPTLTAARDAQGGLTVAGLRLLPAPVAATPPPPTSTAAPAPAASTAQIDTLDVAGVSLRWRDDAVQPAVTTTLILDAHAERLAFGAGVAPSPIRLELRVGDSVESLALRGDVRGDPDDLRAELELTGRGLRAGGLASYLPPDVQTTLTAGRLRAAITAQRTRVAAGGHDTRLEVRAVEFADGDAALLSIDRLAMTAPRLDAASGVFDVDEIAITGLTVSVERPDIDTITALGFAFTTGTAPTTLPAERSAPDATPAEPALAVPTTPPTVTLRKLDVGIANLTWHDAASGAAPVQAALRLTNAQPWRILDADPEALPPLELSIDGAATPAFAMLHASLQTTPFAADPQASIELRINGIDAHGIVQAVPSLRPHLVAGDVRDGVLQARLEVGLHVRRRQPTDLGLDRPFGVDLALTGLALRHAPDGALLAGLEALNVEASKITPATGDVHIKTLELIGPAGIVRRLPDGLHALGFVVPPTTAPATENPPPAAPIAAGSATEAAASKSANDGQAPEIRIDELTITGLDFRYEDSTVEPPFEAPLEALDVEVRGFTTRAFTETRPLRFRASLSSGKVAVPERHYASLLGGLLGAAAKAIGGSSDSGKLEPRRFFDEISTSGRLSFHPTLEGRVRTSINSLELLAFRQLARSSGVIIGDGVLDAGIDLQFRGAGGLTADSRFVFQHLSVDEPADGPISRYLRLPAPLDTVLFVLRNDAGEQNIPLNLAIADSAVGGGQMAAAAATALGSLITDAIASAPFRIVGTLTDIAGATGGPRATRDDTVHLQFEPFETALSARARAELDAIVAAMLDDDSVFVIVQHELGGGDIARGDRVALPEATQIQALVQHLLARQAELRLQREQRAAQARVQLVLGHNEPYSAARAELEAVEREAGENEQALDAALALLGPGAERTAEKRARQLCVTMASDRLENVRRAIVDLGGAELAARIELRKPRFVPAAGETGGRVVLTPRVRTQ